MCTVCVKMLSLHILCTYAFLQTVFEFHESTNVLRSFYNSQQSLSSIYFTSEYMFATAISSPGYGGVLLKTSLGGFNKRPVIEDSVEHFVAPMDVRVFHRQELQNLGEWEVAWCIWSYWGD